MTRRKTEVCPKIAAAKAEGKLLRQAIIEQLRKAGPQTAAQIHAAIGGEFAKVREGLYRLTKAGGTKSVRGVDQAPSTYHLDGQTIVARNVGKPHRPVVKEYPANQVRDPFALPAQFFGMLA